MIKIFRSALISFILMTVLCGILYTASVTALAQALFPQKANGSIITAALNNGEQKEYGSALIAQEFTKPQYMIGRPMGTTNLSPFSEQLKKKVQQRKDWLISLDPENTNDIPMDLVTGSGSGVDPHISPAAAQYQVPRLARERGIAEQQVKDIIQKYTDGRFLGFIGEPAVNVLKVNLALDGKL